MSWGVLGFPVGVMVGAIWTCGVFVYFEVKRHGWRNDR